MKILNISLKELLKNKLYFSYFAAGLAILLAVICVPANYSRQIFDGFFTQFNDGGVMTLEMSALPSELSVYEDLPVFARGAGLTYDITLVHGERSVDIPGCNGGLCVVSEGDRITPSVLFPLYALGNFSLREDSIYLGTELAEELDCVSGGPVNIADREYEAGRTIPLPTDLYNFIIFDPNPDADEFALMIPDADRLLEISEYLTPENYSDDEGILALCDGYRGLKAGMSVVIAVLTAVCALYIFAFIGMYLSKRGEFVRILFRMGIRRTQLFGCLCAVFAPLCFIGSAVGFLLSVLLDKPVDKWAGELLGMGVEPVNYAAYFVICFAVCVLAAAVSLLLNMAKTSSEGEAANQ